jgi:hypothetical protein
VTLTPSRVRGTRYSQPSRQASTSRPNATSPCNDPASTIAQNSAAGMIAATVSAVSLALPQPGMSSGSADRWPACRIRRLAADQVTIVITMFAMASPTHTVGGSPATTATTGLQRSIRPSLSAATREFRPSVKCTLLEAA